MLRWKGSVAGGLDCGESLHPVGIPVEIFRAGAKHRFLAPGGAASTLLRMDKAFLVEQLGARMREAVQSTHRAATEARSDSRSGAARAVNLARGQTQRELSARAALDALELFRPRPVGSRGAIGLGALVELECEEKGQTLFLAPVGAGEELEGPGGDGIFQVVTPASPFGRAVMGKRVGDVVEVWLRGEVEEWTITYAE